MYHHIFASRSTQLTLAVLLACALPAAAQKESDAPPKPRNIRVEAADGVELRCTYYKGTEGKRSVPIIMLHGWDGVRGEYSELATYLQRRGHAVIAPDLRGHGRSDPAQYNGRPIERKRMTKAQIQDMIQDIEACKKYLVERHNQGELNIDTLCVIAAKETCALAVNWAIIDWSWPVLTTGKQGQDVKALVLLSPVRVFRGVSIAGALQHDLYNGQKNSPISLMIVAGDRDARAMRDAGGVHSLLSRSRPKVSSETTGRDLFRKHDLALVTKDVELQGTKLLDPAVKLRGNIRDFLRYRVVENASQYPWRKRGR